MTVQAWDALLRLHKATMWRRATLATSGLMIALAGGLLFANPDKNMMYSLIVLDTCAFILSLVQFRRYSESDFIKSGISFQSTEKTVRYLNKIQEKLLGFPAKVVGADHQETVRKKAPNREKEASKKEQRKSPGFRVAYSKSGESPIYSADRSSGIRHRKDASFTESPITASRGTIGYRSPVRDSPVPMLPDYVDSPVRATPSKLMPHGHSPFGGSPVNYGGSPANYGGSPANYGGSPANCPNCASPLVNKFPHSPIGPTSETDEKAYTLLLNLAVVWDIEGSSSRRARTVASYIDDWTDNLTKALCKFVREHIVNAYERNTELLVALPGNFFTEHMLKQDLEDDKPVHPSPLEMARQRALQAYNTVLSQSNNNSGGGLFGGGGVQQNKQDNVEVQQAVNAMNRLFEERTQIKQALTLPGAQSSGSTFPKRTVLQRVKSMFVSSDKSIRYRLHNYSWDSSTPPFDPDIVVHIACVWLDRSLRIDDRQMSFSQYHLRDASSPLGLALGDNKRGNNLPEQGMFADQNWWGLQRTSVLGPDKRSLLPHYDLVVQGQFWNVRSGRHNALHALVLLIYSMKANRVVGIEAIEYIVGGHSFRH
mmetsp:Transcript_15368/g.27041  ORF Transcript_15368/g.27041 Transcript_15368/m.27041 type:complete len:597 (+) Transcript_15368:104-1894(+)